MGVTTFEPKPHRAGVIAADTTTPDAVELALRVAHKIKTVHYLRTLFFTQLTAPGAASITIQPIYHDERRNLWYVIPGQSVTYNAPGNYILELQNIGLPVYMLVTAISGAGAQATIEYSKALVHY